MKAFLLKQVSDKDTVSMIACHRMTKAGVPIDIICKILTSSYDRVNLKVNEVLCKGLKHSDPDAFCHECWKSDGLNNKNIRKCDQCDNYLCYDCSPLMKASCQFYPESVYCSKCHVTQCVLCVGCVKCKKTIHLRELDSVAGIEVECSFCDLHQDISPSLTDDESLN